MKKMTILLTVAMLVTGCTIYDIEQILLQRDDVSLTCKGNLQFSYDEKTCQMAYNNARNEFRVHDDAIANWFTIRCYSDPATEGQTLKADLSWTTSTDTKTQKGLEFMVKQVGPDGKIWMWNDSARIGVVVRKP